jgi:hypothetical protein
LAVVVILDATIIRTILVPASMGLFGDCNWFLPSWLLWLPNPQTTTRRRTAAGRNQHCGHTLVR